MLKFLGIKGDKMWKTKVVKCDIKQGDLENIINHQNMRLCILNVKTREHRKLMTKYEFVNLYFEELIIRIQNTIFFKR